MANNNALSGGKAPFIPSEIYNPLEEVQLWELPETEISYLLSQIELYP